MARFVRNSSVLLSAAAVILVAGCAAPMPQQIAKNQPTASQAEAKIRVSGSDSTKSSDAKDAAQTPAPQKQQQQSLTGQLADSLVNVLATFTGH
ncbi:MAG TPA: hypothetical protein VH619_00325 [Verrucomicrobiae bacterium]|jgi:uncharacterized lipoprotein YajG|nr:hypothetical protein [Verrucomicrobiae bacterium]